MTTGNQGDQVTNRFGFPEYFALASGMGWSTILVTNLRDALYKKMPLPEAMAHAAALAEFAVARGVRLEAIQVGSEAWALWPPKPTDRAAPGLDNDAACAAWLHECLIAYADAIRPVAPDVPLIADAPLPLDGGGDANRAAAVWRAAVDHDDIRARYGYLSTHACRPMGHPDIKHPGAEVDSTTLSDDDIWTGLVATRGRFGTDGPAVADQVAYDEIRDPGFEVATDIPPRVNFPDASWNETTKRPGKSPGR